MSAVPGQVPVGRDYRLTAAAVARAVNKNTVLVVASSPCFPHGVVDDVAGIAQARAACSQKQQQHTVGLGYAVSSPGDLWLSST